jgi:hypothetical protein
MTDDQRRSVPEWPDEEGGGQAQEGLRSDTGASMSRPKEEVTPPPDRTAPSGQRGPAGAGEVPGRGKLGSQTPGEEGVEDEPR